MGRHRPARASKTLAMWGSGSDYVDPLIVALRSGATAVDLERLLPKPQRTLVIRPMRTLTGHVPSQSPSGGTGRAIAGDVSERLEGTPPFALRQRCRVAGPLRPWRPLAITPLCGTGAATCGFDVEGGRRKRSLARLPHSFIAAVPDPSATPARASRSLAPQQSVHPLLEFRGVVGQALEDLASRRALGLIRRGKPLVQGCQRVG